MSRTPKKIIEFFIFHRNSTCLLHLEPQEDKNLISNKAITASSNKENEHRYKLLFGLLFSMRSFVKQVSPDNGKNDPNKDALKSFSTANYKVHYEEFLNGLRFIIITTPMKSYLGDAMRTIFQNFYTTLISKNVFANPEEQIKNEVFMELVNSYLITLNKSSSLI